MIEAPDLSSGGQGAQIATNDLLELSGTYSQRRPLVLMGAYGFSQLEAAEACHCTVGTVKSRVSRGRATLTRTMAPDEAARSAQMSRATVTSHPTEPRRKEADAPLVAARPGSH